MSLNNVISSFSGKYKFLSNFYVSPFQYSVNNHIFTFKTVEHFYQAYKSTNLNDFTKIVNTATPADAKRLGRHIALRDDWDAIKTAVMYRGLCLKFGSHTDLRNELIKTFPSLLIEGNNWHDNFWGQCMCKRCIDYHGCNFLGQMLMVLRYGYISVTRSSQVTTY